MGKGHKQMYERPTDILKCVQHYQSLEKCKLNDNLDSDTCHFFLNKTVKNKMKNYD